MEKLLEEISFEATDFSFENDNHTVIIDDAFVKRQLSDLATDDDLSRYIL